MTLTERERFKNIKSIFAYLIIFGSMTFTLLTTLVGYSYVEGSAIYVIYNVGIALLGYVYFVFAILQKGKLSTREVFMLIMVLLLALTYFITDTFFGASEMASDYFKYMLIWSIPAFLFGMVFFEKDGLKALWRGADVFMILTTIAVTINGVFYFVNGQGSASVSGSTTYQTMSYMSALALGLNYYLLMNKDNCYRPKFFQKSVVYKVVSVIFLLPQALSLIVTGGRGGMILLIVYFIAITFFNNTGIDKRWKTAGVIAVILGTLLLFSIENDSLLGGITRIFDFIGDEGINWSGTSNRGDVYSQAGTLISNRPILGYGIWGYFSQMMNPHNLFLELLLGGGVILLIIGVLLIIAMLVKYSKAKKQDSRIMIMFLFFLYNFVMLMFSGTYLCAPTLWFFAGAMFNYKPKRMSFVVEVPASVTKVIFAIKNKASKIKDFGVSILASVILSFTTQLAVYPLLGRWFTPAEYGTMLTLIGLMNALGSSFGGALNNSKILMNSTYEKENAKGDSNILAVCCMVACFLLTLSFSFLIETEKFLNILMVSMISMLVFFRAFYSAAYRIQINFVKILISNVCGAVGYGVGLVVVYFTKQWYFAFLFGEGFSCLFILFTSFIIKEPFRRTKLFKQFSIRFGFYFVSNAVTYLITYMDRFFLYPVLGPDSVSIYTTASILGKTLGIILTPISGVLLSYYSKDGNITKKQLSSRILIFLGLATLAYGAIALVGYPILNLFYPTLAPLAKPYFLLANLGAVILLLGDAITPTILRYAKPMWITIIQVVFVIAYVGFGILGMFWKGLMGYCLAVILVNSIRYGLLVLIAFFSISSKKKNKQNLATESVQNISVEDSQNSELSQTDDQPLENIEK